MDETSTSKEQQIAQLMPDLEALIHRIGANYPQKRFQIYPSAANSHPAQEVGINEGRVLGCIRSQQPINAVSIAQQIHFTKGGVSKIMRRLAQKGLVRSEHRPGNQKEIFYSLTEAGQQAALAHLAAYTALNADFLALLAAYSEPELDVIERFIRDVLDTPWD